MEAGAASFDAAAALRERVLEEVHKAVVGQDQVVESLLVGLLSGGHVLLEGVPGVAKTLMVRALARALDASFHRIQFTPDLMPADILGTRVFDLASRTFNLTRGPIFADVILADEINRAPPKTQAALLEAMQERQVTLDGERHALPPLFTVFATQNPIESEGTYPLPEAQLDRFLFKVVVGYPSPEEEDRILARAAAGFEAADLESTGMAPVVHIDEVLALRRQLRQVLVSDPVRDYVRRLVAATREAPELRLGAGPRAAVHLLLCARTLAALRGRAFVTPDDIRFLVHPVLAHRVLLDADAEIDGVEPTDVLDRLLEEVEVPR
ncbi:MAG: MoxR family ATPase [Deltaproteobacteria bacterium]|nr:MAG: MoxR family ATPase [Deltaproteobacteria bacterium]